MKVAILVQCHKNPGQINRLLKVMEHRDVEFFLHIDLKSTMEKDIAKRKDVHILPKRLRVKVAWGGVQPGGGNPPFIAVCKGIWNI